MLTLRQISATETYTVRQPVLRPGKAIETCIFEGDDLATTLHLGLFTNGILIGIISIFKLASQLFEEENQYQLRGMAVLPEHQKKGYGEKLVEAAEKFIIDKQANLIWFNARENAVGFYKKLGYKIKGDIFEITGVGPHYVMYKKLQE